MILMLNVKDFCSSKLWSFMVGKSVSIRIQDRNETQLHLLGPIVFSGVEPQKLSTLKNAPDKRDKDGKQSTPPMFRLNFGGERASLVFVAEDTTVVAIHNGLRFILDKNLVDVVLYEHE